MPNVTLEKTIGRSVRLQLTTALALIVVLVGGLGGVAAYAEIGGAVIGAGTVIVAGRAKEVQHADGGTIETITVKEGERIKAGDVLFRLDGTSVRANLAIVNGQLQQLLAQEARLLAEQGRVDEIVFPDELKGEDPHLALLRRGQIELMKARKATIDGRKMQIVEQGNQFRKKIEALESEQEALTDNIRLLDAQIDDFALLHRQGLMAESQLTTIKRERATLMGNLAARKSEIVETQQAIGEREIQKIQLDEEFLESVLTDLDEKRVEIAKLREERVAAADRLKRLDIRAPMSGFVHQLTVHTVGRVVAPGETLLQVIPSDDDLVVEAKFNPTDIDQINAGQHARVKLTGLDQRVTPQLFGEVLNVAPDLTTDPKTGAGYFTARVKLSDGEVNRLGHQELRPGMPVEVFMETGTRTILSYLAKPLRDQIEHAMREN